MDDLEGIAHAMGIRIEYRDQLHRRRWGEYDHKHRTIRLLGSLRALHWRCTLAHELGHAYHGHRGCRDRQECEADAFAARLLIHPDEWRTATAVHDRLETVAAELTVWPKLVRAYAMLRHPAGNH